MDGDDIPVDQRCDGVVEDFDRVDLPDGVTPLHKFIWRPRRLLVGDYIDELDSGNGEGDGFRVTCTLTNGVLHFLVVIMVRQIRLLYRYIRLAHEIRLNCFLKAAVGLTVDNVACATHAETKD